MSVFRPTRWTVREERQLVPFGGITQGDAEAALRDANLIAGAPDAVDALEKARDYGLLPPAVLDAAERAVAKACFGVRP